MVQLLQVAIAAFFILNAAYFTGTLTRTLTISGIFLAVLVVQLVLWIPFVGNIGWLRSLPPLNLFLFSRSLPEKFQRDLGTYKPPQSVLDHKSTTPSADLATKIVGDNEYYVIKPSSEFGAPVEAVQQEVQTMLEMSTIASTKDLPDRFQGVFWMKGNGMQEELAVLGLSTWDEKNLMLTKVSSVATWSWHDSEGGYTVAKAANDGAWDNDLEGPAGMTYFKFTDDSLESGRLWTSTTYNYNDVSWLYSLGHFSLEKIKFDGAFTWWNRGCYWGGEWIEYDFGSYSLTRISKLDGTPIQPGYDEYVEYRKNLGTGTLMLKGCAPADDDKKQS